MTQSAQYLNPSDAARKLGISTKALRLYEARGMIAPTRTSSGWRTYGPVAMARADEIVALRALGLSLADVANVIDGDGQTLERVLAAHEKSVKNKIGRLGETLANIRNLRGRLAEGVVPASAEVAKLLHDEEQRSLSLTLPWPWGGETFELRDLRSLNYITGPLGSGKTQLARAIAKAMPDGKYLGLERLSGNEAVYAGFSKSRKLSMDRAMKWLCDEGAVASVALTALVIALQANRQSALVIDLIEQGLDKSSQAAIISFLQNRAADQPPLFLMTRSNTILDLEAVGPDETVILCPANHSPPMLVAPYPGAAGFEAVTTCLASPDVRLRTEGVIAMRP